jgi:tRNA-binding EMAP/Myf-like protein
MKEKIAFDQFLEIEKQLEIKIGLITEVEFINKKMLKLTVSFGGEDIRTVVTNIGQKLSFLAPMLKDCKVPFITNLKPAMISGFESSAMIMVTENSEGLVELPIQSAMTPGAKLL